MTDLEKLIRDLDTLRLQSLGDSIGSTNGEVSFAAKSKLSRWTFRINSQPVS
jgi:hypothetical protein